MNQQQQPAKVAVIGVGRMGHHHARIYSQMPGVQLVAVVDQDSDRAGAVADEFATEALSSPEQLVEKHPDLLGASVAVPTRWHMAAAGPLLKRGIACLVEKPLAPSVAEAKQIAGLAREHGAVLQVGHTERFNPAVRAVAKMNIPPRFIEVDRVSPMTFRSLDVGVVMDMMIHDLDIVLSLVGSPIESVDAVGVAVMGENEDVASARLHFASGCVANLTASRLALKTERKLRLFSESAYVSLDYQKRSGVVIARSGNQQAIEDLREQIASGQDLAGLDYSELVHVEQLDMDQSGSEQDPLTAQLSSFLDAARTGSAPTVDAEAGYAAVDAAERVVAAIREHRWEGLSSSPLCFRGG
ncbi:MAG: Gfo/Idh/MocA family oxidoreductase [Phycisphaeraceae bacterium]